MERNLPSPQNPRTATNLDANIETATLRKLDRHLIPFLALLYFAAFLDRVSVGFAAAQMTRDLGFSAYVFGLAAGIFFVGYCLFEVPSTLLLHRVGARRWLARIMITWGLIAGAMALISNAPTFYVSRFLLGVAEAGFFPGIVYYLTQRVPAAARAKLIGRFMIAIPLSTAVAGPVSTAILRLDGAHGLSGWQWLFLIETLPSLLLGIATLRYLPDRPADAAWLSAEERQWLAQTLEREALLTQTRSTTLLHALTDRRVLTLSVCYFGVEIGLYGVILWIPQIFANVGFEPQWIGLAVAIPYGLSAIAMVSWARRSDQTGERVRHIAIASLVGFLGLTASGFLPHSPVLSVIAVTFGAAGTLAILPIFWTLPAQILRGAAAAGAIALINAIGNLGGFAGPFAIGWLKTATGSFTWGLVAMASGVLATGIIALLLGDGADPPAHTPSIRSQEHEA